MASGANGFKQSRGYFVPLGNCATSTVLLNYAGGSGAGGSYLPGNFTGADWAVGGSRPAPGLLLSTVAAVGAGGYFKDMGKTVVSSNRTFRKVQLVTPGANGVYSAAASTLTTSTSGPFYTAYIEMATGPIGGTPAPVAYLPGLM